MRSEQEMLSLIVDTARQDERIRAVVMNGSRANPEARRDFFRDFDILYLVTDVAPFKYAFDWIKRFGEIMILQMPEDMQDPPPQDNGSFVYLMQFTDGNRIDLSFFPLERRSELGRDSLSILLLDKDGRMAPFLPASDRDYLPRPPSAKAFADCCNEFWWLCPYVAKGLWRQEILFAKYFMDHHLRGELMKMVTWYAGVQTRFSKSPGKGGKYLQQLLEPETWEQLLKTYPDAGYANIWEALFQMGALFRLAAGQVAAHFGFDYPAGDDQRVSAHLRRVQQLPRDAAEMY